MDDFKQLRYLVALYDHPSMQEAANSLGITKSALSQSIRRIEDIYGVSIFDRSRRGMPATHVGEILVNAAREGINIFKAARDEVDQLKSLQSGRLTIGCDPWISELILPPTFTEIMRGDCGLQFAVTSGFWKDQQDAIRSKAMDLYIGILPDEPLTEFNVRKFSIPGIRVFSRPGHPLTRESEVKLADVYRFPIVAPYMPDWFYYHGDSGRRAFGRANERRPFILANDAATVRDIVRHSDGISGGFRKVLDADLRNGTLVLLPVKADTAGKPLPAVIVTNRDKDLSPLALHMIRIILKTSSNLLREDQEGAEQGGPPENEVEGQPLRQHDQVVMSPA
jgi:DNA-binding transcriptional LysR family regulator